MQVTLREAIERAQASMTPKEYEVAPIEDDVLERSGIPPRFRRVPPNSEYISQLVQGKGLYIWGDVGVGKTHTACAILRAWVDTGGACKFTSALGLLDEIRDTFDSQKREADIMERYGKTRLLVIDDLGKECPTEWALSKLFGLINTRYEGMRPTIITTQYQPPELVKHLARGGNQETAKAIVSRLLHRAEVIHGVGEDRRAR